MAAEEKKEQRLFLVESSPHVAGDLTTPRVMLDVLIALLPATVAALLLFRAHAILLMVSCVAGAILAEVLANRTRLRAQLLGGGWGRPVLIIRLIVGHDSRSLQ